MTKNLINAMLSGLSARAEQKYTFCKKIKIPQYSKAHIHMYVTCTAVQVSCMLANKISALQ